MKFFAVAMFLFVAISSPVQASELQEFSAYYQANTNGMRGRAERHLIRQDDEHYRLNISLEAKLAIINIGDLEQSSEFSISDGEVIPHNYNYLVTGITREKQTVSFDWESAVALSTEDDQSWSLQLESGVLDQLSYQAALALRMKNNSENVLEFKLVDGDSIETHRYRVLGSEKLETPLGLLNATKLERIREQSNGRKTLIWLADDWDFLLTRIEQISGSGLRIELELENAMVAGQPVTPLTE